MIDLRMILTIVVIAISIVISGTQWTAHKKNTRRSKKREAGAKSSLPILRRLLPEEAAAVRQVYKREIPDGSLVYQVCGGFRENSLVDADNSGKSDCHYWIGAIEVEFDAQWYEFLQPENTAEVVWQDINSSDKACILKLNEGLDITRFQNQDLATAPDDPGQTASAQIRTLGTRPVTPAEKQYLDQRLWNFGFTGSLIIAASVIHLFRGGATFLTILTALGLFWVGSWLWRRRSSAEATEVTAFEGVFDQKQPKLIDQYGQARKQSSYNSIGRLHTDMPAQWLAYFKPGQHCRVAALLEKSQRYFPKALLVEAAPGLSVDKEIKRFGPRLQVEHHVTLCTVLAVVLLILFNVVDHPGAKAKRIGRALLGRDQPMEYADLADLLENPPDFDDHIVVHVARTVGILSKSHTQWIGLKPHEVFETRLEGEYIGDRLPYEPIDLKWEQKQARKLAGEIECINASDSPARLGESICNNPDRPGGLTPLVREALIQSERKAIDGLQEQVNQKVADWLAKRFEALQKMNILILERPDAPADKDIDVLLRLPVFARLHPSETDKAFEELNAKLSEENLNRPIQLKGVVDYVRHRTIAFKPARIPASTIAGEAAAFAAALLLFAMNFNAIRTKVKKNRQRERDITAYYSRIMPTA